MRSEAGPSPIYNALLQSGIVKKLPGMASLKPPLNEATFIDIIDIS